MKKLCYTFLLVIFFICPIFFSHSIANSNSIIQPNSESGILSPIKIKTAWIQLNSIKRPILKIVFFNPTDEAVDAIAFNVEYFDNFDEEVYRNNYTYQELIKPSSTSKGNWFYYIHTNSAVKKSKIHIERVHFANGFTWQNTATGNELDDQKDFFYFKN